LAAYADGVAFVRTPKTVPKPHLAGWFGFLV
jgi:hypothetical protein